MNHISPQELSGLHAQARQRAQELRREAIDDFWRGAQRLAHRLARHRQQRAETQSAPCKGEC